MAGPETVTATPSGVIHDIGYQRYDGPRLGRWYAVRSLYVHGVRTAFGLGRSAKAKIFPWLVVGIVGLVAAVLVAIRSQTDQAPITYAEFPEQLSLLIVFFVAILAPELLSRDLRSGVLPLYFSRPLRRTDYALAKYAALATALFAMLAGAQLLMFVGGAFTTGGMGDVWAEVDDLLAGVGYSAVHALLFAAISVLIASLVSLRAVAAGVIVGVFLFSVPVAGVLTVVPNETVNELAGLTSPLTLVGGVGDWLFETTGDFGVGSWGWLYGLTALLVTAGCIALLMVRYRKVAR